MHSFLFSLCPTPPLAGRALLTTDRFLSLQLVSSKQLTCFSDFRAGDDEPDFLAAKRYREYLTEYCTKFQLWPHINVNTKVTHITRKVPGKDGARHVITYLPKSTGKEEQ